MCRALNSFYIVLILSASLLLSGCSLRSNIHKAQGYAPKMFEKLAKEKQAREHKKPHEVTSTRNGVIIYRDNQGYSDPGIYNYDSPVKDNGSVTFGPADIQFGAKGD